MINILHFKNKPILEQLQLEEALLRTSQDNWLIINEGSPLSIVMGISGKPEELIDQERVKRDAVTVIRRFSGGGTVVVDKDTLFVSWICQKDFLPIEPFPEPILKWTATFYKEALQIASFSLTENDYTIGTLKCGGNAQYLRKNRWLHHTTFLRDYQPHHMDYLLNPKRQPKYRNQRKHTNFLTTLNDHIPDIDPAQAILNRAQRLLPTSKAQTILQDFIEHRKSTKVVEI